MNLLLLEAGEATAREVTLRDHRAVHLLDVLHVNAGDRVRVGLLDGPQCGATVVRIDGRAVTLECRFAGAPPERPRVDLLLALPRPKVLRRLWAQLAALGVGRIIVTNAARVERNYFDTHVLDAACYRPLLIEGLQQARDTRLPVVSVHRQFKPLIEDDLDRLAPALVRLVAHPDARSTIPKLASADPTTRVLLAVGPEGGWNSYELELLETHGFRHIGMGARTLRTDTACVALLALVHGALEVG